MRPTRPPRATATASIKNAVIRSAISSRIERMSLSSSDNGIPLLTEVISAPATDVPAAAPHALYWEDVPAQPPPQPDYHQHFQPEPVQAFQPQYQPSYDSAPLTVPVNAPMPALAPVPSVEQIQQIRQEIQETSCKRCSARSTWCC